ncbi:MAG: hypothetical protein RL065_1320, partial [Bacteroidota bacterium]
MSGISALKTKLSLNKNFENYYNCALWHYREDHNYVKSNEYLQEALKLNSSNAEGYFLHAQLIFKLNPCDNKEILKAYYMEKKSLDMKPDLNNFYLGVTDIEKYCNKKG